MSNVLDFDSSDVHPLKTGGWATIFIQTVREVVNGLHLSDISGTVSFIKWRRIAAALRLGGLQIGLELGYPHILQTWLYHENCMTQKVRKQLDPYPENGFGRTY